MKFKRLPSSELRWLIRELLPFWRWHLGSVLAITAGSLLSLVDPLIMRWLIDKVLPSRDLRSLGFAVAAMFCGFQGRAILTTAGGYCNFVGCQRFMVKLRIRLVDHLNGLSADYHETTPVGAKVFLVRDTIQEIGMLSRQQCPYRGSQHPQHHGIRGRLLATLRPCRLEC